ncbi:MULTISPECIES: hypothetical protein [Streptomyces]|uniref:hypothetical protein n=1 Tax=Streptomyces TaxID=1883 RepID=UPI0016765B86|nr:MULTISPECIES: hypothetical protein [Streptomyces]MBD3579193.1 hypothetical protein [Streptomyces sp. KD18]GGT08562.1 hypothetical protein GCM10010286_37460 [Streptomyces toxytricini]
MSSDTLDAFLSPCPPAPSCPPARRVPAFAPLRVGPGRYRLRPVLRRRRRTASGALALIAAVLAVAGGGQAAQASRGASPPAAGPPPAAVRMVSAPVRIADAATVRLLRPGDRVDVVAAERAGPPRLVAAGARVARVPAPEQEAGAAGDGGALVVLSVPRDTARELVGAAATARLAVALC